MRKITFIEPPGYLSETVDWGFRYMMVDKAGNGLHMAVQCKDFLTDVIWSEHMQEPINTYGFNYEPGLLDLEGERFSIAVTHPTEIKGKAPNLQAFLNVFEASFGVREPCHVEVANEGNALIVTFDRFWYKTPVLVSAFALFLRCGLWYKGGPILTFLKEGPKHDLSTLRRAEEKIAHLLNGVYPRDQAWNSYSDLMDVHHRSGLIGYPGAWTKEKA